MNRHIVVNNGYYFNTTEKNTVSTDRYDIENLNETITKNGQDKFVSSLSSDLDIFSELPKYVYENEEAKKFLDILRKVLLACNLSGITLSKLYVSEHSDSGLVLDWIYNYFRVYFSFDSQDGNYYGVISKDVDKGRYSNNFSAMDATEYETIAKTVVEYVLKMLLA